MSEYKRWISYIYYYDNKEKKNNVGYARAEIRGTDTRITVHINTLGTSEPMKVFLFVRKDDMLSGITIGEMTIEKGVGHGVYNIGTYNIKDTGRGMSEIGGIIIMCEKDRFFASEWDDSPIEIDKFSEMIDETSQNTTTVSEEDNVPQNITAVAEEDNVSQNITAVAEKDNVSQNITAVTEEDKSSLFDRMFLDYPPMYPFEENDSYYCVRIEPQDIGKLPLDTWVLANNSFLLQGFYSYRHLILMKSENEGKNESEYRLGVPGLFHNREDYLAKIFGFNEFIPMKKTENLKGEFGYWCILLSDMPETVVTSLFS